MEQLDTPIYTVHQGRNSGLIKSVAELYFNEGDKIADVTYGKGVFWREIDLSKYEVVGTDLKTGTDFRDLPYKDNSFNHSVIDPPYARITNLKGMVDCYNTTRFTTHEEIIKLYEDGLKELVRITKEDGYILCKCQDEICGGKQRWSHIEILDIANKLGLYAKDLFILVNSSKPKPIHKQQHARKTHSYLWIFQK
ncbi:DNA methyltransferase [uncultured Clostridium sp.]|uniref:DNA methyltransferase n=1 Tax=uncultured Clostridium sp. TaxID=59620 RepID=UPI0028EB52ED|nr:DNA methyltransferase [uncultured Clostridium sp.]